MDDNTVYVTPESLGWGRNATDHRVWNNPTRVPVQLRPVVTTPTATVATAPVSSMIPQYQYPGPGMYPAAYPQPWAQPMAGFWGPGAPGYVYPPPGMSPSSNLATILGGFGDLGSLASIAAQIFAAFLPLPTAPTPQDSTTDSDPATNAAVNSSNLIRYQNALAGFARRDQQILTVGSVLKELLKRPGFGPFGG
jgi:hypothetical protein